MCKSHARNMTRPILPVKSVYLSLILALLLCFDRCSSTEQYAGEIELSVVLHSVYQQSNDISTKSSYIAHSRTGNAFRRPRINMYKQKPPQMLSERVPVECRQLDLSDSPVKHSTSTGHPQRKLVGIPV